MEVCSYTGSPPPRQKHTQQGSWSTHTRKTATLLLLMSILIRCSFTNDKSNCTKCHFRLIFKRWHHSRQQRRQSRSRPNAQVTKQAVKWIFLLLFCTLCPRRAEAVRGRFQKTNPQTLLWSLEAAQTCHDVVKEKTHPKCVLVRSPRLAIRGRCSSCNTKQAQQVSAVGRRLQSLHTDKRTPSCLPQNFEFPLIKTQD